MGGRGSKGRARTNRDVPEDPLLPPDATARPDEPAQPDSPDDGPDVRLESNIRAAYSDLATKTQDWIRLSVLRERLGNPDKTEMDRLLMDMVRTGRVHLAPSSNRKALTDADHGAAIRIGGQDKHLIAIEPGDA
jgi:hypothetical protein